MTDRERLEKLSQEKERTRQEAQAKEQQRMVEQNKQQADQKTENREKTNEIFDHCIQFQGFKLRPTGHEVAVDKAPMSKFLDVQPDGQEYVSLHISHWGPETNDFQGQISILLTRFRNGEYQVITADGLKARSKTLDELKEKLVEILSDMDTNYVKRLFEKVRSRR